MQAVIQRAGYTDLIQTERTQQEKKRKQLAALPEELGVSSHARSFPDRYDDCLVDSLTTSTSILSCTVIVRCKKS